MVKRVLKRWPELLENVDPENGWSSLHYASFHGRYLICTYLIQLGHDQGVMLKTYNGDTCIHLAMVNGDEQTLHLLLQHFLKSLNYGCGPSNWAPIHIACRYDHYRCLNLLLDCGVDIMAKDVDGNTGLHVAMEFGSNYCVEILVKEGGKQLSEVKNRQGWKAEQVGNTFEMIENYKKLIEGIEEKVNLVRHTSYQTLRTPVLSYQPKFVSSPTPLNHQIEELNEYLSNEEDRKSSKLLNIPITKLRSRQ